MIVVTNALTIMVAVVTGIVYVIKHALATQPEILLTPTPIAVVNAH